MGPWAQFLVIVVIGIAVWWVLQPSYQFVVRIDKDAAQITKGKVTETFLHQLREACDQAGVVNGWVGGVRNGRRVSLTFSRSIPPGCRQQIRNAWLLHG